MSESSIQKYISSISKAPLLTEEEEKNLTTEYFKTKSASLRDKIIRHNMRLVVKAAFQYGYVVENVSDLIQEGSIGLLKGVEHFDPTKNVRLANYAYHWIKAYILRYIINNAHLIKVGTTLAQRKLFFNLTKTRAKYLAQGIELSPETLANKLGVKLKELQEMEQRMSIPMIRLDHPSDMFNDNSTPYIDKNILEIVDFKNNSPSDLFDKEETKSNLKELLPKFFVRLSDRDRDIFNRRLIKEDPDTLEDIGLSYDLTRERIRQVEMSLKTSLKKFLKNNNIDME